MRYLCFSLFFLLPACAFLSPSVQDMVGLSSAQVQNRMGPPVIKRTESPYQIWAYRKDECSILVYFDSSDHVVFADTSGECSAVKN